jgi:anti-anti-sigma factor
VELSTEVTQGIGRLELEGELDAHVAGDLDQAIHGLLGRGCVRLILGFAAVSFISSAGLRVLLVAQRAAQRGGGEIRLHSLTPTVRKVFELTGFDRVVKLCASPEEAAEGW